MTKIESEVLAIEIMLKDGMPINDVLDVICDDYLQDRLEERLDNTTVSVPA